MTDVQEDGNSTPYNISIDTPAENFRYLTTHQALADVVAFAHQFERKNISEALVPLITPWIFIGGSYSGMRAAFMRELYNWTIYASLASSAPVQAQIDLSSYFEPVYRGLAHHGYGNCTKDIHAAISYIDHILDTNETAAEKLKDQFLGRRAVKSSHGGFADALAAQFFWWQGSGVRDDQTGAGLGSFCDYLSFNPATNKTSSAKGWAAKKGAKFVVDRWASHPRFVEVVNESYGTDCSGNTTIADCDLDRRSDDPETITWMWQYCTEWGMSPSTVSLPFPLLSAPLPASHATTSCTHQLANVYTRVLPIRQPRPPPARLEIQLSRTPARSMPSPIPRGYSRPPARLAARQQHQRSLRRLVHSPSPHVLDRR